MSASKIVLSILRMCISVLIFLLVVFAVLKLSGRAYDLGYRVYTEKPMEALPGRDKVVEVSKDMSAAELGTLLEEKGLVRDASLFWIQMKLSAYSDKVKPGLYTLNTAQGYREMLQVMAAEESEEDEDGEQVAQ